MGSLEDRLDFIAKRMGMLEFPLMGGTVAKFEVKRQGQALEFRYGNIIIKVGGFKLVDPEEWSKTEPSNCPAVSSSGIVNYFYTADVTAEVKGKGKTEGHGVALGCWYHRDRLLASLGWSIEQGLIAALLSSLDQALGGTYHTELLEPARGKPIGMREERATSPWRREF